MPTIAKSTISDTYMKLISELPLRRIKTPAEHTKAAELVLRLSIGKNNRGAGDYLDVLVDLMVDYEKRTGQTVDTSDLTAADMVRHRIEERGISISALAKEIGVAQSNLSEMLNGNRDWSKAAIRGLSKKFHIRAERFLQ